MNEQLIVPFHVADVGDTEADAVASVVRSGWLTMGPRTLEFEKEFAKVVSARHAIAVSSCTAALHLALEAIGIKEGDEVLVPTTTFTASAEVVAYLGAIPRLVDVDPETLNLSVADAEGRVTPQTRAILPVHYGGQPCDMDEIHEFSRRHNLHIIEDAAHALPSAYRGKMVGSLSEITAFSFYATKTLTTGEGGMITTDNDSLAERMRLMRLHGIGRDAWKRYSAEGSWYYEVLAAGYKYNMTDIQAALGLVQLGKCQAMCDRRKKVADRYNRAFQGIEEVGIPVIRSDRTTSWHLYPIRIATDKLSISRDQFIVELKNRGVGTSVHFIPLHLHPYYQQSYGYRVGDYPVAEREYARYLSLPIFPTMTDAQINHVIESVSQIVKNSGRTALCGTA